MIETVHDEGFGSNLTGNDKAFGYDALDKKLLSAGLSQYLGGNIYVYQEASNFWNTLAGHEVQIQINSITGATNATTNYGTASSPYANYIRKHSGRAHSIPCSVCIGTRRLSISLTSDGIATSMCTDVVDVVGEKIDKRVSSFCVMPCDFVQIPTKWSSKVPGRVLLHLSTLFPDGTDLATIMWVIGNAAVDPSLTSKFLLLHGNGGSGKSRVITAIENCMVGCSATIGSGAITKKAADMDPRTAGIVTSHRFATAGDMDATSLNLHAIKEITGHDSISIPPLSTVARR